MNSNMSFVIFGLLVHLLVTNFTSGMWNTTNLNETDESDNQTNYLHFLREQQDCNTMFKCPQPLETKSKVLQAWDKLGCRCDDACLIYGDCCSNWAGYDPKKTREARNKFKCVNFVAYQGIYLLSSCPKSWTDKSVRDLCETAHSGDGNTVDPVASTPVTSLDTRFTYPNYYCAVCNGDIQRVLYWTPRVECDALQVYNHSYGNITNEYVWNNLQFNTSSNSWGVHLPNNGGGVDFGAYVKNPSFVPCRVVLQMPTNVVDIVRQCHPWIDDCPSQSTNTTELNMCQSYTAVIYSNFDEMPVFRNIHCAICNNQNLDELDCRSFPLYRNVVPSSFAPSFAFLFDINENDGAVVGALQRCPSNEVYDPFFRVCRQMVCANPSQTLRQGKCVTEVVSPPTTTDKQLVTTEAPPNVSTIEPSKDKTTKIPETTNKVPTSSENDCPRFNITYSEYEMYDNGTVYIPRYSRMFSPGEYVTSINGTILVCSPLNDDNEDYLYRRKFSVFMAYLTLALLGISLTCIFFHMLAFMLVPSLRNLSGKNLASLCVALFIAYVTFIISQFDGVVSQEACTSIAVILYYCFLATFFWMNAIAFDVWRTLRLATSELRVSSGQQWRKFVVYSLYSWLGPAAIVASSIVVENSPSVPRVFRPAFGQVTCWFGSRRALLIFFVAPVITVLFLNVVMFILSAHIIIGSTHSSAKFHPGSYARRNFFLYLRLALIMGLTWVFGITAGQLDTEPLWYIFVFFNTLQGLFIFLSFTCTKKVRNYLRDKVFCKGFAYHSSTQLTAGTRSARKFELEGRDSGSGESQTSHTSRTTLTKVNSMSGHMMSDPLY